MKWIAADSSGVRVPIEADTAENAAQEYVDSGEWGSEKETFWVNVSVWPEDDPENRERIKIAVEPAEPSCVDSNTEHDWQSPFDIVGGIRENPGVWGHGGGVTIQEVCVKCGCGKLTDTWAQDLEDGTQGLSSTRYEPHKYDIEEEEEEEDNGG